MKAKVYASLALIAAVYIGIQCALPHTAFLSNDGGEKLVQVKALLGHDSFDPSIPYDPLGVEPEGSFRFAPFLPGYAFVHEGKLFSIVPFYFPLASSLGYSAFGHAGLFILPLLGSVLTVWLVAWVSARTLGHASALLAALTTGLATSVFFYGLTFWEHSISMCLAMGALALLHGGLEDTSRFPPRIYAAGLVLALGAWMRTEVVFLTIGLAVAMLLRSGSRRQVVPLGAGFVTGLLPFFILNQVVYGSPFGPQVVAGVADLSAPGELGKQLMVRWTVTKYLLFTYVTRPWLSFQFFLIATGPAIYFSRIRDWNPRHEVALLVWIAFLVATVSATFGLLLSTPRLLRSSMRVAGLFVALPVLPFALAWPRSVARRDSDAFHAIVRMAVSVALAMLCMTLATAGGLQWGPRYALVLFPPLILLAVRGIADLHGKLTSAHRRRGFAVLLVLLLVSGVSVQALGIRLLRSKKLATVQNNEAIRAAAPRAILTDTWWFPQDSGDLLEEIPLYKVGRNIEEPELLDGLRRAGINRALVVSKSDLRAVLTSSRSMTLLGVDRTRHSRTPTFDLFLYSIQLIDPQPAGGAP